MTIDELTERVVDLVDKLNRVNAALKEYRESLQDDEDCDQDTDGTWRPNAAMQHGMELDRTLEKHGVTCPVEDYPV